ncbi:MAG: hypothetical protein WC627_11060 [Legionella sp.]|jgi:Mrp family chromosome partitioning ATPase
MTIYRKRSQSINKLYVAIIECGCQTVCFTSAELEEGLTTIASVVAQTAASYGRRVLYCDFGNYNTSLSVQLHMEIVAKEGSQLKLDPDTIRHVDELGFDLMTLPGPRPLDTSLIKQENLEVFFSELKTKYDLIIIDAHSYNKYQPYTLPTRLLCEVADATVLVILSGVVTLIEVKDTTTQMVESGVKLLGIVMNDRDYPRLLDELLKVTTRLDKYFPKLAIYIRKKLHSSVILNTEI